MPTPRANRNQSGYQKLVDEALTRLPVHSPEWTNYNDSDPGVTLVQVFAWFLEELRYRLDGIPESSLTKFRKVAARLRRRRRSARLLISGGNKTTRAATARFIASSLGLSLRRIDLSSVDSKYTGETEKNLRRLLDSAESSGAILFFDEADALFGKRSEVKDSHDRYANQEMAWLLRRLGRHQGLVILATSRKETSAAHRWCKLRCDVSKLAPGRKRSTTTAAAKHGTKSMPSNPQYPGVYVQEVPSGVRTITGVPTSIAAFIGTIPVGALDQPAHLTCFADFERDFGTPTPGCELGYAVHQFFLNGGSRAWVVRIPDSPTEAHWLAGIHALDSVDLFNLLVLPGVAFRSLVAAAVEYCEKRRAFLILDPPREVTAPDEIRQRVERGELTDSRNAGIYYPWLKVADPWNNGLPRLSSPGGTIAGLFARTDATRGVWKAPAGTEASLNGVIALEYQLTDEENRRLNPHGINCLRLFPNYGFVAWGSRTLAGDDHRGSEWKYIPTRRLALFLEESLYRGLKWVVFELNDEPLWAQIRLNVGAFMHDLFRQGAFQGATPKEAYFVKCDGETTTQNDCDLGIVNIQVGFAPQKPGEFVILKLQQRAGQAERQS